MLSLLQPFTSPPSHTLRTFQPTPSTISYTVSTRPVPKTLPALLALYISVLVRIVVGALVAGTLWVKWHVSSGRATEWLGELFGSTSEAWLVRATEMLPWRYLAPGSAVLLYMVLKRGYTEESLTLLRGLGLQTSTSSSTLLTTPSTRFIPSTNIQDIFIHEAFKGFEVRFYLAIVVKGEEDVVVVFPSLLPRRAILEEVWRGARACLYEGSISKGKGKERDG
ncbi:GPI-GlcNAc transferase complex, PIG-H component-domain-containing protein [Massariosphaeria phaeospora]|uniref:GPI-GlcNAc transferase complex, PIG-H component-domain-containing protein n=1 Tax=Massariosphaeria phaeospora TaxID=100035 RepID=A0A7C8I8U6_9PLEO|nr:GPI-GlcNAc transferase complex, PIG-H component-domain-containing protein [Massariosphaeria phaeospora]